MAGFDRKFFEAFEKTCAIDGGVIDADHRGLYDLIIALQEMVLRRRDSVEAEATAIRRLIDTMVKYAEQHFRREEDIMKAIGYPGLDEQEQQHAALFQEVRRIKGQFDQAVRGLEEARAAVALLERQGGGLVRHGSGAALSASTAGMSAVSKRGAADPREAAQEREKELRRIFMELPSLLGNWLVNHIMRTDLLMRPYIQRSRPS